MHIGGGKIQHFLEVIHHIGGVADRIPQVRRDEEAEKFNARFPVLKLSAEEAAGHEGRGEIPVRNRRGLQNLVVISHHRPAGAVVLP